MAWPSKNVPYGGILHPAKSSYSPETHQFLKVLMEESKLSMRQRREIDYCLRTGDPLPPPKSGGWSRSDSLLLGKTPKVTIQPGPSKRRSRDAIVESGAYQRERFILNEPIRDREVEKQKLQDRMAYGKDVKKKKSEKVEVNKEIKIEDPKFTRFDQLTEQIRERKEWLKEMEKIGEGDKYRLVIQQQIQERINEIDKLKLDK